MKKTTTQQEQLRQARKVLNKTNAELAAMLGKKSEAGILAWLAPEASGKHRTMPKAVRMLLTRIVAEHRAKAKR